MRGKIQETVNYDMSTHEPYANVEYIYRCEDCLFCVSGYCERESKIFQGEGIPTWCTLVDAPKEE